MDGYRGERNEGQCGQNGRVLERWGDFNGNSHMNPAPRFVCQQQKYRISFLYVDYLVISYFLTLLGSRRAGVILKIRQKSSFRLRGRGQQDDQEELYFRLHNRMMTTICKASPGLLHLSIALKILEFIRLSLLHCCYLFSINSVSSWQPKFPF